SLHYGHGTDNAADEAYWLVRAAHGWDYQGWNERPDTELVPRVLELARRRAEQRRPLAYLLGEAWFAGLRFSVDEHVLIPRSPIAELIERCYAPWCELESGDRVLDIGTGSGCLAIATAVHCPGVRVEATEISAAARRVAAVNIAALAGDDDVVLLEADLYPAGREPYRLIVSNPPYVPSAELAELPAEYEHEPAFALDGGPTGLDVVERILAGAAEHLLPGGVLIVEVGGSQDAFTAAHPRLPVTWLEFERGGDGVLLTTREELTGHLES
ncbi:MAG TPA: 50S ribosomal protein L3 N(5)-glutamine methyltransferase, partial [Gammaproteobacteria bacterium]|nr:50S ribosomal protein L3 N(5)-glutamine methyltransferase [Gammaproteobacteria bacterium]